MKKLKKTTEESKPDNAQTTTEERGIYIQNYTEQEKILGSELALVLQHAIKNFSSLQRIIYADFARMSCLQGDHVEDLGRDYRSGYLEFARIKNEPSIQYPLIPPLSGETPLRVQIFELDTVVERDLSGGFESADRRLTTWRRHAQPRSWWHPGYSVHGLGRR